MLEIWFYSVLNNIIIFIDNIYKCSISAAIILIIVIIIYYVNDEKESLNKLLHNRFIKPLIVIFIILNILKVLTPSTKYFEVMLLNGPVKTFIIQSGTSKKINKTIDLSLKYLQKKVNEKEYK